MSEQNNRNNESGGSPRSRRVVRKKRRINRFRVAVLLFVLILLIAVVIAAVLMIQSSGKPKKGSDGRDTALFGVKSIAVEGTSHYTEAQITEAGGIYTGQSVFFVNKRRAAENILKSFPYVETVTISNPSFSQIKISIREAEPVGVIRHKSGWLIIGDNGKGLEELSADSSRLADYRVLKCNMLKNGGLGHLTLDDRSLGIIDTVAAATGGTNLEGVREVDFREFTDIKLNWRDMIQIRLGNDVSLESKLGYASKTLERVLAKNGENVEGQIDLSVYSEANPKAIFTPEELLTAQSEAAKATG